MVGSSRPDSSSMKSRPPWEHARLTVVRPYAKAELSQPAALPRCQNLRRGFGCLAASN